jgi:acyl-CoA synthetase (AMP-forming)/AMP-acid ligase II
MLRRRAASEAAQTGYVFLKDGVTEAGCLSYEELDRQASKIAAHLLQHADTGDRALLLYPQGLDFIAAFFGCLYAGILPIPAYPPRPNRGGARIHSIAADAQARLALTTSELLSRSQLEFAGQGRPSIPVWIATDALAPDNNPGFRPREVSSQDLAYLQYTSGSTSTPKGVMISYGNLTANLRELDIAFMHSPESVLVTWLPAFHDMGLIYGVIMPLYRGFPCYMMAPAAFLQRPARWLQAMSDRKATHSAGPNFAYELCVRKIRPAEKASLDLSHWKTAVNGSEPVRPDTINGFAEAFGPYGFRRNSFCPGYGLAEATLKVTGTHASVSPRFVSVSGSALESHCVDVTPRATDQRVLTGCGRPEDGTCVEIVNPETHVRCEPWEVGEVWIKGPGVAQGYWNRPEESALTFGGRLVGNPDDTFLRSGDLGFLSDGELYITGRIRDMIIIRGQNHYPQDIELTVERCHPALRQGCGIAFSVDAGNEERLVIAYEVDPRVKSDPDADDLIETIRQEVSEVHDLQVYSVLLVQQGEIPRTSSGKLQRSACRAAFLTGMLKPFTSRKELVPSLAGREDRN